MPGGTTSGSAERWSDGHRRPAMYGRRTTEDRSSPSARTSTLALIVRSFFRSTPCRRTLPPARARAGEAIASARARACRGHARVSLTVRPHGFEPWTDTPIRDRSLLPGARGTRRPRYRQRPHPTPLTIARGRRRRRRRPSPFWRTSCSESATGRWPRSGPSSRCEKRPERPAGAPRRPDGADGLATWPSRPEGARVTCSSRLPPAAPARGGAGRRGPAPVSWGASAARR